MNIKLLIVFLLIDSGLYAAKEKKFRKKKSEKGVSASHVLKITPPAHGWASHVVINWIFKKGKRK